MRDLKTYLFVALADLLIEINRFFFFRCNDISFFLFILVIDTEMSEEDYRSN